MTRAMTSMLTLALLALPVLAEEPKKTETPAQDSPLVAASKRANRLGKKKPANVITNETVKKSGATAHVTTTTNPAKLPAPPPAKPAETVHAAKVTEQPKPAATTPEDKKKTEEERQRRLAMAAEAVEEEHPDDVDPAQAEKELRDAQAEQKPPRA